MLVRIKQEQGSGGGGGGVVCQSIELHPWPTINLLTHPPIDRALPQLALAVRPEAGRLFVPRFAAVAAERAGQYNR